MVLVVAVVLLTLAVVLLGLALRSVDRSPSPSALEQSVRAAADAAGDLDDAVAEFRAAVDDRADR